MPQQASDTPLRGGVRPLSAAEVTAVSAGRRLYSADAIGPNATVNTILCHTALLQPRELHALDQIGEATEVFRKLLVAGFFGGGDAVVHQAAGGCHGDADPLAVQLAVNLRAGVLCAGSCSAF